MKLSHALIIINQTTSHLKGLAGGFWGDRVSAAASSLLENSKGAMLKKKWEEDRNPHKNNVSVVSYGIFRSAEFGKG